MTSFVSLAFRAMTVVALVAFPLVAAAQDDAKDTPTASVPSLAEAQNTFWAFARAFVSMQEEVGGCNITQECLKDYINFHCEGLPKGKREHCIQREAPLACCDPLVLTPDDSPSPPRGFGALDDARVIAVATGSGEECAQLKPADVGCKGICNNCTTSICRDGEWQEVTIEPLEDLCRNVSASHADLTVCRRSEEGTCPQTCSVCY